MVSLTLIRWIVIYPVDSAIQLLKTGARTLLIFLKDILEFKLNSDRPAFSARSSHGKFILTIGLLYLTQLSGRRIFPCNQGISFLSFLFGFFCFLFSFFFSLFFFLFSLWLLLLLFVLLALHKIWPLRSSVIHVSSNKKDMLSQNALNGLFELLLLKAKPKGV